MSFPEERPRGQSSHVDHSRRLSFPELGSAENTDTVEESLETRPEVLLSRAIRCAFDGFLATTLSLRLSRTK